MKKIVYLCLLIFSLVGCSNSNIQAENGLSMHIFKIGKADSILLSYEEHHVLIDTGEDEDAEEIIAYLNAQQINTLDALIITHFDKDHVGGADHVINNIDIKSIYTANYESDSKQTKQFLQAAENKALLVQKVSQLLDVKLGDQQLHLYPAEQAEYDGDNEYSLIATLSYGTVSFLLTGDAEEARLKELVTNEALAQPFTIVKMPHHGRFNEMTTTFVETVKPQYAVITSSSKNVEAQETVSALQKVGAQIFTTRNGDIHIETDGTNVTVVQ